MVRVNWGFLFPLNAGVSLEFDKESVESLAQNVKNLID